MKKRILFVDDEEKVLKGMRRMLAPKRAEWDMDFVTSGQEALRALSEKQHHVIVADLLMPGMTGHELLKEVKRLHPEVKRIVLTGQPNREYDGKTSFPAHQYIMKPCDYETLSGIIEDILFVDAILMDPSVRDALSRIETLPALPEIYQKITSELESSEPSMEKVAAYISEDLGLASKLIALVNSPYYGFHREISDVRYAVMYLGLELIRTLVLTCQAFSLFDKSRLPGFSLIMLWEHGMRTACLSKRLALLAGRSQIETDRAFLAGLLHDVGKLVLGAYFNEEYNAVLALVRKDNRPIHAVERDIIGATHAEAGAYLLGLWGVRPEIVKAIALHHSPASVSLAATPLLEVYAGNILDHVHTVIHPEYSRREESLDELKRQELFMKIAGGDEDVLASLGEVCR